MLKSARVNLIDFHTGEIISLAWVSWAGLGLGFGAGGDIGGLQEPVVSDGVDHLLHAAAALVAGGGYRERLSGVGQVGGGGLYAAWAAGGGLCGAGRSYLSFGGPRSMYLGVIKMFTLYHLVVHLLSVLLLTPGLLLLAQILIIHRYL